MTENNKDFQHKSVLADELIKLINLKPGDLAIDCTTGGGGHSSQMLEKISPSGKLLALDQDQEAITHLGKKFATLIKQETVILEHSPFERLETAAMKHGFFGKVSGIMADIGVSSHRLIQLSAGFHFKRTAPLICVWTKQMSLQHQQ